MPTATYREFPVVLQRSGFRLILRRKHETWEKTLPTGEILLARLSHQQARDIPTTVFHHMLRQARLTQGACVARNPRAGESQKTEKRLLGRTPTGVGGESADRASSGDLIDLPDRGRSDDFSGEVLPNTL